MTVREWMAGLGQRDLVADGIAHAVDVLDEVAVAAALDAVRDCRADPGPYYRRLSAANQPAVESDLFRWRDHETIRDLVTRGPLVDLAQTWFGTGEVVLLEDQWFWSSAGSATGSPWHQDEPYHPLDTPFLTIWLPLTPVPAGLGLKGVRGSHLGPIYAPVEFAAENATLAAGSGFSLEPVPDVDADPVGHPVLDPAGRPGEAVLLDSRTLHAAGGHCDREFVRLSIRYAHPDTRFVARPWPVAAFWDEHDHRPGRPLAGPAFPLVSR